MEGNFTVVPNNAPGKSTDAANGKSAKHTARIVGVSRATVEWAHKVLSDPAEKVSYLSAVRQQNCKGRLRNPFECISIVYCYDIETLWQALKIPSPLRGERVRVRSGIIEDFFPPSPQPSPPSGEREKTLKSLQYRKIGQKLIFRTRPYYTTLCNNLAGHYCSYLGFVDVSCK